MGGQYGDKETKDVLIAANEIGVLATKQLKDGVQVFEDFAAFFDAFTKNEDFKAKMKDAWDNHQAVANEVKELDLGEIMDLAGVQLLYLPKYVEAAKA